MRHSILCVLRRPILDSLEFVGLLSAVGPAKTGRLCEIEIIITTLLRSPPTYFMRRKHLSIRVITRHYHLRYSDGFVRASPECPSSPRTPRNIGYTAQITSNKCPKYGRFQWTIGAVKSNSGRHNVHCCSPSPRVGEKLQVSNGSMTDIVYALCLLVRSN